MVPRKERGELNACFAQIPVWFAYEPVPQGEVASGGSPFTVHLYGFDQWGKALHTAAAPGSGTLVQAHAGCAEAMRPWLHPDGGWRRSRLSRTRSGPKRLITRAVCTWTSIRVKNRSRIPSLVLRSLSPGILEGIPPSHDSSGAYPHSLNGWHGGLSIV